MIKIVRKARSTALRHLPRTHRIDVNWLFDVCSDPHIKLKYVRTTSQVADLMTKAIIKGDVWPVLLDIAQIRAGPMSPDEMSNITAVNTGGTRVKGRAHTARTLDACDSCGFITADGYICPCHWS